MGGFWNVLVCFVINNGICCRVREDIRHFFYGRENYFDLYYLIDKSFSSNMIVGIMLWELNPV